MDEAVDLLGSEELGEDLGRAGFQIPGIATSDSQLDAGTDGPARGGDCAAGR